MFLAALNFFSWRKFLKFKYNNFGSGEMSIAEILERAKNKGWLESSSEPSDKESRFDQVNLDSSIASATQTAVHQPGSAQPSSSAPLHASEEDPDIDEIDELFSDLLRYSPDTSFNECTDQRFAGGSDMHQKESFIHSQDPQSASSFTVVHSSAFLVSHSCQSELKATAAADASQATSAENHRSVNEGRKNNCVRQSKLLNADEKRKKWQEWQNVSDSCDSVPCDNSSAGPLSEKSGFVFGSKISFGLGTKAKQPNSYKSREVASALEESKQEGLLSFLLSPNRFP